MHVKFGRDILVKHGPGEWEVVTPPRPDHIYPENEVNFATTVYKVTQNYKIHGIKIIREYLKLRYPNATTLMEAKHLWECAETTYGMLAN